MKFMFTLLFISIAFTQSDLLYKSENLIIKKISKNSYIHVSYIQTETWGKVGSNGMIAVEHNQAIIFDTPTNNKTSLELINWVRSNLKVKITAVVPTHFHKDCLGGLDEFHKQNIPSYANSKTIELASLNNYSIPLHSFRNMKKLKLGKTLITLKYFGGGHTEDNIISYFPNDKVIFGGCLIKSMKAGKGNLEDAKLDEWSSTVEKIKQEYPQTKIVVPGHGKHGGTELLDKTSLMFKKEL